MIVDTVLPIYAASLVGATAWIRARRPGAPRYVTCMLLPAVVPALLSAAWFAAYAFDADPRLALSLLLAYVMSAWLVGVALCAATDFVTRKACGV